MKILNTLQLLFIGLLLTTSSPAFSHGEADQAAGMPMMNQGQHMMTPEMMEQMMKNGNGMPMMQRQAGNMMNQKMVQLHMQHMQHMEAMEQHLQEIESLLAKILDAQTTK